MQGSNCCFLAAYRSLRRQVKWKWKSCLSLCDPIDYKVHGILQAKILEWISFPFSRGSSQIRDQTQVSHTVGRLYQLSHKGSPRILEWVAYPFSSRSSWPKNQTRVSCIAGRFFTNWVIRGRQRQVRWSGIPISLRIFYSLLGSKQRF